MRNRLAVTRSLEVSEVVHVEVAGEQEYEILNEGMQVAETSTCLALSRALRYVLALLTLTPCFVARVNTFGAVELHGSGSRHC